MYDALVPVGPILVRIQFRKCFKLQTHETMQLALSAASPFYRGYIADVDCRWNVIAGSVDDRTEEERGLKVHHLYRD